MKKILYVEDTADTAAAVQIILTHAGYEVKTAKDGKEGLANANSTTYDLILLDVMLPDMSGWDIYAALKQKSKAKFAFLSAIPVSGERMEQIRKEGVSDYIMKPFNKNDLTQRVKRILGDS